MTNVVSSSVVPALIIAGYLAGGFLLWRARASFGRYEVLGWLVWPVIGLWVAFYLAVIAGVPFPFLQWASRFAHGFNIAFLALVSIMVTDAGNDNDGGVA